VARTGGAVAESEHLRAIAEALDHLLDPLEDALPGPNGSPRRDGVRVGAAVDRPRPTRRVYRAASTCPSFRTVSDRVRWSNRGPFRATRLIVAWALLVGFFLTATWLVSSRVPP
jgi:hypothetical protein